MKLVRILIVLLTCSNLQAQKDYLAFEPTKDLFDFKEVKITRYIYSFDDSEEPRLIYTASFNKDGSIKREKF